MPQDHGPSETPASATCQGRRALSWARRLSASRRMTPVGCDAPRSVWSVVRPDPTPPSPVPVRGGEGFTTESKPRKRSLGLPAFDFVKGCPAAWKGKEHGPRGVQPGRSGSGENLALASGTLAAGCFARVSARGCRCPSDGMGWAMLAGCPGHVVSGAQRVCGLPVDAPGRFVAEQVGTGAPSGWCLSAPPPEVRGPTGHAPRLPPLPGSQVPFLLAWLCPPRWPRCRGCPPEPHRLEPGAAGCRGGRPGFLVSENDRGVPFWLELSGGASDAPSLSATPESGL
nr:uncharacterized protein LOC132427740 [Delphinus delphis]